MWGPHVWGFGWIFPVMGMLMLLVCLAMAFRFASSGRGFTCMSGCRRTGRDRLADIDRDVDALREEIRQLKASR